MKLADVAKRAFAMPLTDPAYPRGPYKFYNREFVVISYRSDPDILREVVPEPRRWLATRSTTSSSACPTPRVLAIIPRPAR
jgi:acetoacetate decarboxylase